MCYGPSPSLVNLAYKTSSNDVINTLCCLGHCIAYSKILFVDCKFVDWTLQNKFSIIPQAVN